MTLQLVCRLSSSVIGTLISDARIFFFTSRPAKAHLTAHGLQIQRASRERASQRRQRRENGAHSHGSKLTMQHAKASKQQVYPLQVDGPVPTVRNAGPVNVTSLDCSR